jgi:hypothetical protein
MRHHAITVIERKSSRSAAIAFARRELEDVHGRYTVARPREVAAGVVGFVAGDYPLAAPRAAAAHRLSRSTRAARRGGYRTGGPLRR